MSSSSSSSLSSSFPIPSYAKDLPPPRRYLFDFSREMYGRYVEHHKKIMRRAKDARILTPTYKMDENNNLHHRDQHGNPYDPQDKNAWEQRWQEIYDSPTFLYVFGHPCPFDETFVMHSMETTELVNFGMENIRVSAQQNRLKEPRSSDIYYVSCEESVPSYYVDDHIPLVDGTIWSKKVIATFDQILHLFAGVMKARDAIHEGRTVWVNCSQGRSRSVLFAILTTLYGYKEGQVWLDLDTRMGSKPEQVFAAIWTLIVEARPIATISSTWWPFLHFLVTETSLFDVPPKEMTSS